ncbi:MAG TPA: CRTAC1 family protein [Candidatus Limnocylindrales bacterium]|nr:CRTAC1 family protein [Candidatus Limnocylindrales bacterium]
MKKYLSALVAVVLAGLCYPMAKLPAPSPHELAGLAARFSFKRSPLPELPDHPPYKYVRQVHPSLERIAAWVSSLGAAATLADLDGDGLPNDVCYVDPRTDLVTIAPVPHTGDRYKPFTLSPEPLPYDSTTTAPMGTLAGDFNEDGLMDVLVYYWGRTPVLFLRKGTGANSAPIPLSRGDYVAIELCPGGQRWYSNSAIQADLDGDGHIDLLVGNYFPDGARILDSKAAGVEVLHEGKSKALNGGYKHVFLWHAASSGATPSVQYNEVQHVFSEEIARGWTLAMGAADLDGDLLPELYIANDFGPDRLLHNRSTPGHLKFALLEGKRDFTTPKSCVLGHDSFKGMGVDFGDINGDGLLDIYVSNIATRFGLTESHFLWLNTGAINRMKEGIAPFVNASEELGLSRSGFSWEARLADFDNDGVLEAMQACGFIKGKINRWPELQALGTSNDRIVHNPRFWPSFKPGADLSGHDCNPFFVRATDGRYYNISRPVGLAEPLVSRGIAIADVDGDGRLDFVTANQWGPSYFFRNESPHPGAFLGLRLVHASGSPAIGACAKVTLPGGRHLVAQVDGGTGHSGRRSPEIHFGLGQWDQAKPLLVQLKWRNRQGQLAEATQQLVPGWHHITLGDTSVISDRTPSAPQTAEAAFERVHSRVAAIAQHTEGR